MPISMLWGEIRHASPSWTSEGSTVTQHNLNSKLTRGLITGVIIKSDVRDPQDPLCTRLLIPTRR